MIFTNDQVRGLGPETPETVTPVKGVTLRLEMALSRLEDEIAMLDERTQIIRRPQPEEKQKESPSRTYSPLLSMIDNQAYRAERMSDRVRIILDQLEI